MENGDAVVAGTTAGVDGVAAVAAADEVEAEEVDGVVYGADGEEVE